MKGEWEEHKDACMRGKETTIMIRVIITSPQYSCGTLRCERQRILSRVLRYASPGILQTACCLDCVSTLRNHRLDIYHKQRSLPPGVWTPAYWCNTWNTCTTSSGENIGLMITWRNLTDRKTSQEASRSDRKRARERKPHFFCSFPFLTLFPPLSEFSLILISTMQKIPSAKKQAPERGQAARVPEKKAVQNIIKKSEVKKIERWMQVWLVL